MINWYAFHDGKLDYLGAFESFYEADEVAPVNTMWIFSEGELDELYERIQELRYVG